MKKLKTKFPYLILLAIVLVLFKDLPKTFYQQDEWLGLGNILTNGINYIFLGLPGPSNLLLGEGRFASRILTYFILGGFPFNITPLVIFSLIFHTINTFLVYRLLKNFFQDIKYPLIGAVFFAVNSVGHQAVTWPAAVIGTLASTTLILLSLFAYFKAIGGYRFDNSIFLSKRWALVTLGLIYLSFHFKETGIFLLLFFPLITLLLKRKLFFSKLKFFLYLLLPFFIIVGYKLIEFKLRVTENSVYITGLTEDFFSTILARLILYPLTSFSLMFTLEEPFLKFAHSIMYLNYPFFSSDANAALIAQTVVLDLLAIILTFLILVLVFFLMWKEKIESKKVVLFWLTFSFMSFLPYVLLAKNYSYLESRYYYAAGIGGAFLLSWTLRRLNETLGKKIFLGIAFIAILYLGLHANIVRGAISEQVSVAGLRKDLITQLKNSVPFLERERNIFYITSDRDFYFEGNKIPFQQGTGYTLMILYRETGKIPEELFKEEYLFELGSQGYKEIESGGFGYFWDKKELDKAIRIYNLEENSIIRLYYDSNIEKLKKIEN